MPDHDVFWVPDCADCPSATLVLLYVESTRESNNYFFSHLYGTFTFALSLQEGTFGKNQFRYIHYHLVSTRIIADNTAKPLGEGRKINMDPNRYQHSREIIKNIKRGPRFENTFPAKLYNILCQPELSFVISWLSNGNCWKVLNRENMETFILPLYFNMKKYQSLLRQVNGWGFKRVKKGVNKGSYHHVNFLYDQDHLIRSIKRVCASPPPKKGCHPS